MATRFILSGAPTTGETPFYSNMMQEWAQQTAFDRDIECYCLDAPLYLPTGSVKAYRCSDAVVGQDRMARREA